MHEQIPSSALVVELLEADERERIDYVGKNEIDIANGYRFNNWSEFGQGMNLNQYNQN